MIEVVMNFLQMRLKFRELSGRFDLVDPAGADLGAGFFLNEGRKFLDRLDETQKSWGTAFRILDIGNYSVQVPYCRAIKEVWITSATAKRQLEKKGIQDLISGYLSGDLADRAIGIPQYYSPCITRIVPENQPINSFEAFLGMVDIPAGNAYEFNSILVNAPTDQKLAVMVNGLFYSAELVNDTDENQWSVSHPLLLYMAAMRQIEVVNRNTQGVQDWERSIGGDTKTLGMDLVEELIAETSEMEG
jgi:hypothetical protein